MWGHTHYRKMGWNGHHGWGHYRGGWFFPPFALFFLLFAVFFIFKTGLWLPLLLLGGFLWVMPALRRYWHEGGREQMRTWSEKAKRDWNTPDGSYRSWDEKPKCDDNEYV